MAGLKQIIEAVLFVSSRPLTILNLQKKLDGCAAVDIEKAFEDLLKEYNYSDRAIEIVRVSGGFQMRTRADYRDWVKGFAREKDAGLTRAMLETLALIAYKQPISKHDVDKYRGVDSARSIKLLLDKRLVEMAGRNDEIGKPIVFRTTRRFLEVFGLNDIGDLPTLREMELIEKN